MRDDGACAKWINPVWHFEQGQNVGTSGTSQTQEHVCVCAYMRLYLHMPSGYWKQTGGVIVISILHLTVSPFSNVFFVFFFMPVIILVRADFNWRVFSKKKKKVCLSVLFFLNQSLLVTSWSFGLSYSCANQLSLPSQWKNYFEEGSFQS